ncbi:J domain-containing protein [Marinobacter sp. Arc7-DN-1]|uniref:J domain-containing protein n=1 Tax=Marinobacter sp. Arc7-DN-1 TaxID=2304594 RepID=UPI000E446246|nr:J domain-containing protein [Marinobacter sp. Arc7-DN-1]AXS81827.1 J domain-containing protein [Marinobacter sp. Arc7-DN-1]
MNCWEILGIEPTGDRRRIQDAYEQQLKFASDAEARRLEQAFREAVGDAPEPLEEEPVAVRLQEQGRAGDEVADRPLDANDGQVVREVVIQIKALLNDSSRSKDVGIWKAILNEPPADQKPLRREIGRQLEPQLRPMAENGTFPAPVAQFLGDWFNWFSVEQVRDLPDERNYPEREMAEAQDDEPPQMVNFWPAIIGWIVGLVILAALFGGMGGG